MESCSLNQGFAGRNWLRFDCDPVDMNIQKVFKKSAEARIHPGHREEDAADTITQGRLPCGFLRRGSQ